MSIVGVFRGRRVECRLANDLSRRTSKYDVFISDNHALDGALAPALETGLEQFAKPWYQRRALRVCRGTTSLSPSQGSRSSVEETLATSAWLALMVSSEVLQSPWVSREITWWLAKKSPQRLLVILTEGEFAWDEDVGHVNDARPALPPTLRDIFAERSRWVDLRWLHDVNQVDQSNPRLQECVADIAATILEVPKDMLLGEHIRQRRRTLRLARSGVIALTVLLVAALAVVVSQWNQVIAAQHTAIARGMMAQADRIRDLDPRLALQLGVAAIHLDPSPLTQAGLVQTLLSSRYQGKLTGHTPTQ